MALWTPSVIDTFMWFDASDATTITIDTGVSQWRDKSGNTRHIEQATGANQPVVQAAELNGLDVLRFDGSDDQLTRAASLPNTYSVFVVGKNRTISSTSIYVAQGSSIAGRTFLYGERSTSPFRMAQQVGATLHSTTGTLDEGFVIHGYMRSGTTSQLRWFGIAATGSTSADTVENTTFQVGAGAGSVRPVDIAEIVILNSYISTFEAQIIEGYLAHKWGLESKLQSTHPFKSAAPNELLYYGTVRDKTGALATGRGIRAIREVDQVCVAYETTDVSGEYSILTDTLWTGTVTTASASVITDSGQAWTTDEWATHYGVRMTSGAQVGEWRRIASNTATALTLESALPGTTAINDTFEIAALHTLVFSGESDRNALVYSGVMPDEYTSGA
jgi:hypothetical protein